MGMFKDIKKLQRPGQGDRRADRPPDRDDRDAEGHAEHDPPATGRASTTPWRCRPTMQKPSTSSLTTGAVGAGHRSRTCTETGTLVNFNPQVVLDLEVAVDGEYAVRAQLSTSVPQMYLSPPAGRRIESACAWTRPTRSSIAIDWAHG